MTNKEHKWKVGEEWTIFERKREKKDFDPKACTTSN